MSLRPWLAYSQSEPGPPCSQSCWLSGWPPGCESPQITSPMSPAKTRSSPSPPSSMLWRSSRPRIVPLSLCGWPTWWPIRGQPSWLAMPAAPTAAIPAAAPAAAPAHSVRLRRRKLILSTPYPSVRRKSRCSSRAGRSNERPPGSGGSCAPESALRGSVSGGRRRSAPAGHRRQDLQRVAVADGGFEPVEDAHVLVVQVHVDVAVQRAVRGEQLALGRRVARGQVAQHLADARAGRVDLLLAAHGGTQDRRYLDRRHDSRQVNR